MDFVLGYLKLLGFFDIMRSKEEDKKSNKEYINAAIAYLVKQGYKPQWKHKQIEDYNFSPNNQSTEYLW